MQLIVTPNSLLTSMLLFLSAEITGTHTITNHTSVFAVPGTSQVCSCLWVFALALSSAWNAHSLRGTHSSLPDDPQAFAQKSFGQPLYSNLQSWPLPSPPMPPCSLSIFFKSSIIYIILSLFCTDCSWSSTRIIFFFIWYWNLITKTSALHDTEVLLGEESTNATNAAATSACPRENRVVLAGLDGSFICYFSSKPSKRYVWFRDSIVYSDETSACSSSLWKLFTFEYNVTFLSLIIIFTA